MEQISKSICRPTRDFPCYLVKGNCGILVVDPCDAARKSLEKHTESEVAVVVTAARRALFSQRSLAALGPEAKLWVPEYERYYIEEADHFWNNRNTFNLFDTRCDREAPLSSTSVFGTLHDYTQCELQGIHYTVVPTPGVKYGAISLIASIDGRRFCFSGDLFVCGGKVRQISGYQYTYNDMRGLIGLYNVAQDLIEEEIDVLCPAFGPVMNDPTKELKELRANIERYFDMLEGSGLSLKKSADSELKEVVPGLLYAAHTEARTHFLSGRGGKIVALDYGCPVKRYPPPGITDCSGKRTFLHSRKELSSIFGKSTIDAVVLTHHHDDHILGAQVLQRGGDVECICGSSYVDILQRPELYDTQCLSRIGMKVTSKEMGVWFDIDGIGFCFEPISGHTRWGALVLIQNKDLKLAHIGDAFFFLGEKGFNYGENASFFPNHVYKNGTELDSYSQIFEKLESFRPDWILTGHSDPYQPDDLFFAKLKKGEADFTSAHMNLAAMQQSEEWEVGLKDSIAELMPYRICAAVDQSVQFEAVISNPLDLPAEAVLSITDREGKILSEESVVHLKPGEVSRIVLSARAPDCSGKYGTPVALCISLNDRPLGEVAQAYVVRAESFAIKRARK